MAVCLLKRKWCVLIAASVLFFMNSGLIRIYAILFVALMKEFEINRHAAVLPGSVYMSARCLASPFSGILHQLYGTRIVTCVGSLLCSCGIFLCFFTRDIYWIVMFWGVMFGIGSSLQMLPIYVVIGDYFPENITTIMGIAFGGGSFGSLIFPVLCEWLLETYGLHGGFIILAGISMNAIPLCLIFRDKNKVTVIKNSTKNKTTRINCTEMKHASSSFDDGDALLQASSEHNTNCKSTVDEIVILRDKLRELVSDVEDRHCPASNILPEPEIKKLELSQIAEDFNLKMDKYFSESHSKCKGIEDIGKLSIDFNLKNYAKDELRISLRKVHLLLNSDNDDDIRIEKIEKILEVYHQFIHILDQIINDHNDGTVSAVSSKNETPTSCPSNDHKKYSDHDRVKVITNCWKKPKISAHWKELLKIISDKMFIILSLCRTISIFTSTTYMIVLIDFSRDMNFSDSEHKYIFVALSVGDLVGYLCLGWITDKKFLSQSMYMFIISLIYYFTKALLPFMASKWSFVLMLLAGMVTESSLYLKFPILIQMYMAHNNRSIAIGLMSFSSGIILFASSDFIGYFRDVLKSYDMMFYLLGAIGVITSLLWLLEPKITKSTTRNDDIEV